MTLSPQQKEELLNKLRLTSKEEIDCDEFLARLAEYVEGRPLDAEVKRLMDHHLILCPECAEELELLRKALNI